MNSFPFGSIYLKNQVWHATFLNLEKPRKPNKSVLQGSSEEAFKQCFKITVLCRNIKVLYVEYNIVPD